MSRKYIGAGTLLAPLPCALVTVGEGEEANVLTVAWTGILATKPPKTYVSIRPSRHSHALLSQGREFVINVPSAKMAKEVDFAGIYTGKKVDKFKKCGFTKVKSEKVAPPTIEECPIALECRVTDVLNMGTHDVFIADILGASCNGELMDSDGKMHLEGADILTYAHGEYYGLGERVGRIGFSTDKETTEKTEDDRAKKSPKRNVTLSKPKDKNREDVLSQKEEQKKKEIGKTGQKEEPVSKKPAPFYKSAPVKRVKKKSENKDKGRPHGRRTKERQ